MFFVMQYLKEKLPKIIVSGVPTVDRVVTTRIDDEDKGNKERKIGKFTCCPPSSRSFSLFFFVVLHLSGNGLRTILGIPGINFAHTKYKYFAILPFFSATVIRSLFRTTHILEAAEVLGIEAARATIIKEVPLHLVDRLEILL